MPAMQFNEKVSDLIGQIYDCAMNPDLWRETLPNIAEFALSSAVVINIVCPVPGHNPIKSPYFYGIPVHAAELYLEKFAQIDPMIFAGSLFDVNETFTAREAVGKSWTETRMYKQWNCAYGLTEHLTGIIRKDMLRVGAVSVLRASAYDSADKSNLSLLLPHLRRSITIAQMIDDKTVERNRLLEIVDRLAVTVFIVDVAGKILYSNLSGQKALQDGELLRDRNGRLTCASAREQAALLAALRGGCDIAVVVPLKAADGRDLTATILPLDNGYRRVASGAKEACAAVFVAGTQQPYQFRGELVAKLFKLTGAELQLLLCLLEGGSLKGTADRLGVSLATVKTHLQHIFEKTGTSRQSDLVRKVTQLMPTAIR